MEETWEPGGSQNMDGGQVSIPGVGMAQIPRGEGILIVR